MTRLDWRGRTVAISVSALAGYLDAIGFIGSGGFFVSFMSGNSTRAGVGLAHGASPALVAACLVGAFVSGAFVCAALVHRTFRWRVRAVLGLVAVVLTAAAVAGAWMSSLAVFALVAFAMGAVNLLFEENGDVRVGLTYMTGTLVKLGNRLANAVTGGERWSWLPFAAAWLALVAGAALGALAYSRIGLLSLWPAALAMWLLALFGPSLGLEPDDAKRHAG